MIRTTSARIAITIATGNGWSATDGMEMARYGCKIQKGGGSSNIPAMLHGLDCGRVLAAMDYCPGHIRDWLILAYAATGIMDGDCPLRVHERLMAQYGEHTEQEARLAFMVMHNYRYELIDHERRVLGPVAMSEKLGVNHRRFSEQFHDAMQSMRTIMDRWDKEGLREVARVLPSRARAA